MKHTAPQAVAAAPPEEVTPKPKKRDALSRITLALLEQYALQNESNGKDPYNTTRSSAASQHWRGNSRRL